MTNQKYEPFPIYKCVCGKDFIPSPGWVYKKHRTKKIDYFCSYSCWRKAGGGVVKKRGEKYRGS